MSRDEISNVIEATVLEKSGCLWSLSRKHLFQFPVKSQRNDGAANFLITYSEQNVRTDCSS